MILLIKKCDHWQNEERCLQPLDLFGAAAVAAKSLQSCPTLCNPINGSPPGSPVPGILQARTLEWVAVSSSNAWKWKVKVKSLSRVRLLATPWTAAYQAPPSMGFSRQEYWSGVSLPSPCLELYAPIKEYCSYYDKGCLENTKSRDFILNRKKIRNFHYEFEIRR